MYSRFRGFLLNAFLLNASYYRSTNSVDMNLSKLREIVEDRGASWATVLGVAKNWT